MSDSRNIPRTLEQDRNLLFGVLAVQLHKVSPVDLMAQAAAWATDPSMDLAQRLVQSGLLEEGERELIDSVVEQAIQNYGGDIEATLHSLEREGEPANTPGSGGEDATSTPTLLVDGPKTGSIPAVEEARDRYTLVGDVSQGGMGRILLVHDQFIGRQVALKELLPGVGSSEQAAQASPGYPSANCVSRFLQEARITGQLEHPFIVPVYELGYRRDGTLYYTMRYLRGRTLAKALSETGTLRERLRLLSHFVDLGHAIAYAHSRKVIHRDIKPSNVVIGEFGETVVIDWGLAKSQGREDINARRLAHALEMPQDACEAPESRTIYGAAIGTPGYMPPEQALGQIEKIDERSDIYSLGVVLYEILTGRAPFSGSVVADVLKSVVNDPPPPVRELEPAVPRELAAVCERAMQKDPAERYASAKELAEEVEAFLAGALVGAYEYRVSEHLWRFVRKNRLVLTTAAVALLVLAALGAYFSVRVWNERSLALAAQSRAETAHERLLAQNAETLRQYYYASIGLAQQAIEDLRFDQARRYLASCPPLARGWEWGRLQYLCNLDRATIPTRGGEGFAVAIAGLGRVATGGADGAVRLWSGDSGNLLGTLEGHAGAVRALAFSPDGQRLASGGSDGTARLWDGASGAALFELKPGGGAVSAVAFSPDGRVLATADDGGHGALWDTASGELIRTFEGQSEGMTGVAFSPDGRTLATGGKDNTIALWEFDTGEQTVAFPGHLNDVTCVAFSPDGRAVATGSLDGTARLWDRQTQSEILALTGHEAEVTGLAFTPDGTGLLTASRDRRVILWDRRTGEQRAQYVGHAGDIRALGIEPGGQYFATLDESGTAKVWHLEGSRPWFRLKRFFTESRFGASSLDGARFASRGSGPAETVVWSTKDRRVEAVLANGESTAPVGAAAFSPDGRLLATGSDDGHAAIWDIAREAPLHTLGGHGAAVAAVAFAPQGERLATGGRDGFAILWSVSTGQAEARLDHGGRAVQAVAFSPDGAALLTGGEDGIVRRWDAGTGRLLDAWAGDGGAITFVCPDGGSRVAIASGEGAVRIRDARSGEVAVVLEGHEGPVRHIAFGPRGERILTGSEDDTARLWDAETGQLLLTFSDQAQPILYATFWPGTGNVLTASTRDIVIWPHLAWDPGTPNAGDPDADAEAILARKRDHWMRMEREALWEEPVEVLATAETVDVPLDREGLRGFVERTVAALRKNIEAAGAAPDTHGQLLLQEEGVVAALAEAGLRKGDYLQAVNGTPVAHAEDAAQILERLDVDTMEALQFEVLRDERLVLVKVRVAGEE